MALPEPITREEMFLNAAAQGGGNLPEPVTREEMYLNKAATGSGDIPDEPVTRKEMYLEALAHGGGGGDVSVIPLTVTDNGVYTAPSGTAYSPVTVETGGVVNVASATLASEVNWYVAYSALNFKLKYKKSAVLVVVFSDDAATGGGTFTNNNAHIRHNGQTVISANSNLWRLYQKKGARYAPNSIAFDFSGVVDMDPATISADGTLSSPIVPPTSSSIPAGATIAVFEFPYANANGEFDLTPWGE